MNRNGESSYVLCEMEFLVATGIGTGSQPEIFMVINYLNDVPLQFGADGNQVTAIVPGLTCRLTGTDWAVSPGMVIPMVTSGPAVSSIPSSIIWTQRSRTTPPDRVRRSPDSLEGRAEQTPPGICLRGGLRSIAPGTSNCTC